MLQKTSRGYADRGERFGKLPPRGSPNGAEWTLIQYATAKIGAILVNINPAYRVHELEYVLNQAGVRLLVSAQSFKSSDYAAMVAEVRPAASLAAVAVERCTSLYGVPTMFIAELDHPDFDSFDLRWMRTGDLAVMDADGYVSITGRIKDMVIRGGENIYPREIEEFLYTHPDILDAQVIGVPDQRYGEELMAWIRMREGAEALTAEALREFCTGKLAHYKIPRYVHIVAEFPMTVTGKIRKVEMRQTAEKLLNLDEQR
ncbi:AMP-binding protein [Saccharopolyspora sp. ASAGF58]|uniref:AMP-binding enzyme n=1 Tax=Saccharopolyspora sp. ASAGF58 TaxID=2719023 RepID=UPI002739318B|nr:AMP-binding protein [Saccharopolyspora sp. ASAGF58]